MEFGGFGPRVAKVSDRSRLFCENSIMFVVCRRAKVEFTPLKWNIKLCFWVTSGPKAAVNLGCLTPT